MGVWAQAYKLRHSHRIPFDHSSAEIDLEAAAGCWCKRGRRLCAFAPMRALAARSRLKQGQEACRRVRCYLSPKLNLLQQ